MSAWECTCGWPRRWSDSPIYHVDRPPARRMLDPAVCIYECEVRAFRECQNLPKQTYAEAVPFRIELPSDRVPTVAPRDLWAHLCSGDRLAIIDVREPR